MGIYLVTSFEYDLGLDWGEEMIKDCNISRKEIKDCNPDFSKSEKCLFVKREISSDESPLVLLKEYFIKYGLTFMDLRKSPNENGCFQFGITIVASWESNNTISFKIHDYINSSRDDWSEIFINAKHISLKSEIGAIGTVIYLGR